MRVDFRGELIVPVDGSDFSETTLALGAAWGIGLEARPWVVEVLDPIKFGWTTRPRARIRLDSAATSAVTRTTTPSSRCSRQPSGQGDR